jgi:hypothetical protein
MTGHTEPRCFFSKWHFRYAICTQVFFSSLHRTVTRNHCHGAKIDTSAAFIAEFGMHIKRRIHAAVLATSDKAKCLYSEGSRAGADTSSAKDAITISEGIANLLYSATYGNVLNSARVRSLCND